MRRCLAKFIRLALIAAGILAGTPLGRWYPELDDCLLVAVTEKRTKAEIDRLVKQMTNNANPTMIHA